MLDVAASNMIEFNQSNKSTIFDEKGKRMPKYLAKTNWRGKLFSW